MPVTCLFILLEEYFFSLSHRRQIIIVNECARRTCLTFFYLDILTINTFCDPVQLYAEVNSQNVYKSCLVLKDSIIYSLIILKSLLL